ncbi:MAG: carbon monoxide dehydrogenase, partial [Burkholderiales bacterium]|nr:carbon monoxide dehydrogenase [Burkholderiales bacterium]
RSELAPAEDVYKDPVAGMQMTGGSSAIKNSFMQYREIGAKARAMLITAAAQQWNVNPKQCRTENSMVLGPNAKKASYGSLVDAASKLPIPEKVTLKDPKQFRIIGRPTPRLDAAAKSSGKQQFGMDVQLPGMKVAMVARPPVFGGKPAKWDAAKAKAIKGMVDAFEVPTERGGKGIAIVANGYWAAKQGRDALEVEWNTASLKKVDSAKQLTDYKALAGKPGLLAKEADISKLESAPKKIVAEYEFPYLAHAPMEPLNCTVDLKDGACTVWAGSQFQTVDREAVARVSGLKLEQVTLNTVAAGGGFGRRAVATSDYIVEAIHVAKALKASGKGGPLKVIWSREDDIKGGYYRPSVVHRAEIGVDAKGKVLAWNHTAVGQSLLAGTPFEKWMKDGVDGTLIEGLGEPYEMPLKVNVHHPDENVPVLWWRSVGATHTAYVTETLIDELAHLAGRDPVAYRRELAGSDKRYLAALDAAVKNSGYGKKTLPKGHAWGVAIHKSFNSYVAYVVEASVENGAPKLHKVTAGVHCNRAVNPLSIEAQVEGAVLMAVGTTLPGSAVTLKAGVVEQQNFSDFMVARLPDMPQVSVHIVPSGEAPTGMGEPGFPPLAPAYANALFKLTGKRLRKLPFDLNQA